MVKKAMEAFEEMQESIINEIGYALNELICGRTEEAYNILVNLRDELVTDLNISNKKELANDGQSIN
jgi:hypothetical protein